MNHNVGIRLQELQVPTDSGKRVGYEVMIVVVPNGCDDEDTFVVFGGVDVGTVQLGLVKDVPANRTVSDVDHGISVAISTCRRVSPDVLPAEGLLGKRFYALRPPCIGLVPLVLTALIAYQTLLNQKQVTTTTNPCNIHIEKQQIQKDE